jgi:prepilin peptidase CpaA
MEIPHSVLAVVLAFVVACCTVDVYARRIPNLLSGPVILGGLALNAMWFGVPGLTHGLLGILIVVVVLLAPFILGGIGGGDVKMMAGIGSLLGPHLALASLGMGMALGGVLMAIHLVRLGRFREKLGATVGMMWRAVTTLSLAPLRVVGADAGNAVTLPYSVPLGLGTVAVLGLVCRG